MIGNALQFTMRELQRSLTQPRFWLAILAVSLLLGLIGPFGTYGDLPLAARVAYWAAIAISTYIVGDATVAFLSSLRVGERRGGALAFAAYGAAAGLPIALCVWAINLSVYGPGRGIQFLPLLAYCVAIAAVVSVLVRNFVYDPDAAEAGPAHGETLSESPQSPLPTRPRILDRLPLNVRGRLSHLSMQDHYVDVRTDKGGTLVLMRLADAIAETEGVEGLQVHRSHWVAREAIARTIRRDGRLHIEMNDGAVLPVSRPYLQAVRDAGLA